MNIQKAKEQIKKTMQVYFSKDELGNYQMPVRQQRPVFLIGPPGIGKTAIMEQIAQELGVGLVTYSMTHHTRQSALGLPFIVEKEFGGQQYHIAEYTMSEIIASVYREIQEHHQKEGILFLDEINCVSETLAPAMLQFLQYKVFGMHSIPEGWLIVTAGNPPEYNFSAREFDLATWDRLKRIDVEPDFQAWKDYARERKVHMAIRTYLELHPQHFYDIRRTMDGDQFVTARGWEDLSVMLQLYEKQGLEVDPELFVQYLQHDKISEEFGIYYDLYQKYQSDYQIYQILEGTAIDSMAQRAQEAALDERITVSGMLCDALQNETTGIAQMEDTLLLLRDWLKEQKEHPEQTRTALETLVQERQEKALAGCLAGILDEMKRQGVAREGDASFIFIKERYQEMVSEMKQRAAKVSVQMENLFVFAEKAFGNGTEMLLILAELTAQESSSRFIGRYGCDAYYRFSKELMVQERQDQILKHLMQ